MILKQDGGDFAGGDDKNGDGNDGDDNSDDDHDDDAMMMLLVKVTVMMPLVYGSSNNDSSFSRFSDFVEHPHVSSWFLSMPGVLWRVKGSYQTYLTLSICWPVDI